MHIFGFITRTISFLAWLALFDRKRQICGSMAQIKRGERETIICPVGT